MGIIGRPWHPGESPYCIATTLADGWIGFVIGWSL
jgi:hypothetical protein